MKHLIEVTSDVFYICQRLKDIDKDYYILFNLTSKKFEVHVRGQGKNSYAFTVPFDTLDERTLFYARKTRRERMDRLIAEIERENEKYYERAIKEGVDKIKEALCQ